MKRVMYSVLLSLATLLGATLPVLAADQQAKAPHVYPAAILPFQERGRDAKDEGSKVTDLLFAQLAAEPSLVLVDRADIAKLLAEQEVNLSGLVNPQQATKVGQLTGAKLLITGSVLQVDNSVYLIAKIIGTETSRVVGASVKGNVRDDLGKLVAELAKEISEDGGPAGRRSGGQAGLEGGPHRRLEEETWRRQAAGRQRAYRRAPRDGRNTHRSGGGDGSGDVLQGDRLQADRPQGRSEEGRSTSALKARR